MKPRQVLCVLALALAPTLALAQPILSDDRLTPGVVDADAGPALPACWPMVVLTGPIAGELGIGRDQVFAKSRTLGLSRRYVRAGHSAAAAVTELSLPP
jgi:hypothetical protein